MHDITIRQLTTEGYMGVDAYLDISLFEYGIAWKKVGNDLYDIIYGISGDGEIHTTFCSNTMSKEDWITLINESWFEKQEVCNYLRITEQQLEEGFPMELSGVLQYYGHLNIFGDPYNPFQIKEN